MRKASAAKFTSPLPMIGYDVPTSTARAMMLQSAWPSYCWARVRGWMARACTPAASNMRRKSRNSPRSFCEASQPARIFTVTGTFTAFTMAVTQRSANLMSRSSAEPAPPLVTLLAGQPMFRSTMSAPAASHSTAPSARASGRPPEICMDSGRSPVAAIIFSAFTACRISASLLIISDTVSPTPPISRMNLRKGWSVISWSGAITRRLDTSMGPM